MDSQRWNQFRMTIAHCNMVRARFPVALRLDSFHHKGSA
jgi:hypothetical protein